MSESQGQRITVQLSPTQYRSLKRVSNFTGESMSSLVRWGLRRVIRDITGEDEDELDAGWVPVARRVAD